MIGSRFWKFSLLACCLVGCSVDAAQTPNNSQVIIHNGFETGQSYLALPLFEQMRYVEGLVDGIFLAPLFGADKERVRIIERCVAGMTNSQIAAMLRKFLDDRPELWHQEAHTLATQMFHDKCPTEIQP